MSEENGYIDDTDRVGRPEDETCPLIGSRGLKAIQELYGEKELPGRPAPLVPPEVDLRSLPYMPLDVVRLRDSGMANHPNPEVFRSAVLLWCASWHQVPAASLPNDDVELARYAGFGRDHQGWLAIREEALRGFIECSDGRLYHKVVAEKALISFNKRESFKERTKKARAARVANTPVTEVVTETVTQPVTSLNCKGNGKGNISKKEDIRAVAKATRTDRFPEFWDAYPKRDGANPKAPAEKKFKAAVASGVDPDVIIGGARRYANECRSKNIIKTSYVATAVVFLGQRRWGDYPETAQTKIDFTDPNYHKSQEYQKAREEALNAIKGT